MYFKTLNINFASSLILENTHWSWQTHHWRDWVINDSIWVVLKNPFSKGSKTSGILGFKFAYKVFIYSFFSDSIPQTYYHLITVIYIIDLFGSGKLLGQKWAHQQNQSQLTSLWRQKRSQAGCWSKVNCFFPEIIFRVSSYNLIGMCSVYVFW